MRSPYTVKNISHSSRNFLVLKSHSLKDRSWFAENAPRPQTNSKTRISNFKERIRTSRILIPEPLLFTWPLQTHFWMFGVVFYAFKSDLPNSLPDSSLHFADESPWTILPRVDWRKYEKVRRIFWQFTQNQFTDGNLKRSAVDWRKPRITAAHLLGPDSSNGSEINGLHFVQMVGKSSGCADTMWAPFAAELVWQFFWELSL